MSIIEPYCTLVCVEVNLEAYFNEHDNIINTSVC